MNLDEMTFEQKAGAVTALNHVYGALIEDTAAMLNRESADYAKAAHMVAVELGQVMRSMGSHDPR